MLHPINLPVGNATQSKAEEWLQIEEKEEEEKKKKRWGNTGSYLQLKKTINSTYKKEVLPPVIPPMHDKIFYLKRFIHFRILKISLQNW